MPGADIAPTLLTSRDGIVGTFVGVIPGVKPLDQVISEPIALWADWVRTTIIEAALLERLAVHPYMAPEVGGDDQPERPQERAAIVSHLSVGEAGQTDTPPNVVYKPLARIIRPTLQDFETQTSLVANYSDLRADRMGEIMAQLGFPTPYFASIAGIQSEMHAKTIELLGVVQLVVAKVAMGVKHALVCARPDVFSPQIAPILETPGHGTLPSAHAAEAFATAMVLARLIDPNLKRGQLVDMLMAQAARIAINRTVAGVHFPVDSVAGASLGLMIGDYITARATAATTETIVALTTFDGRGIGAQDFDYDELITGVKRKSWSEDLDFVALDRSGGAKIGKSDVCDPLAWLWIRAQAEWPTI